MIVDRKRYPNKVTELFITDLMVCSSAAGYFIGRLCWDELDAFEDQYSCESDYYASSEAAQADLDRGFEVRDCPENELAYELGLPRPI